MRVSTVSTSVMLHFHSAAYVALAAYGAYAAGVVLRLQRESEHGFNVDEGAF